MCFSNKKINQVIKFQAEHKIPQTKKYRKLKGRNIKQNKPNEKTGFI